MANSTSFSGALANRLKKNDLFLLVLLLGSLALNVYLGWNLERLKGNLVEDSARLSPGTIIKPVTAVNMDGKPETISYAGESNPTVFYVFSPHCSWCERNTQNINTIANLRGKSYRIVGLSLADDDLTKFVEVQHFGFPVYRGLSQESIQMLGLGGTPQTIVVSREGRVLKNWIGAFSSRTQAEVEQFFDVRLPGLTAQK